MSQLYKSLKIFTKVMVTVFVRVFVLILFFKFTRNFIKINRESELISTSFELVDARWEVI